jgi:small conductance mechanosensitive channel
MVNGEADFLVAAGDADVWRTLALVATGALLAILCVLAIASPLARDLARGTALLLGRQLRSGDYVELAGVAGVVEHLGLRTVRIRADDGAVHFVRTGAIETVTNRSFGRTWAVLEVPVGAVGTERTMQCLRDAAAELRGRPENALRVLDELQIVGLERSEAGGLQVRARIPVAPGQHANVRRELLAAYDRRLSILTVA